MCSVYCHFFHNIQPHDVNCMVLTRLYCQMQDISRILHDRRVSAQIQKVLAACIILAESFVPKELQEPEQLPAHMVSAESFMLEELPELEEQPACMVLANSFLPGLFSKPGRIASMLGLSKVLHAIRVNQNQEEKPATYGFSRLFPVKRVFRTRKGCLYPWFQQNPSCYKSYQNQEKKPVYMVLAESFLPEEFSDLGRVASVHGLSRILHGRGATRIKKGCQHAWI